MNSQAETQLKMLRPIMNVKEIPPLYSQLRKDLPSLRNSLSPKPSSCQQLILQYLKQGVLCGICYDRGIFYDVLQPGRSKEIPSIPDETGEAGFIQPNLLFTDGVWLWPGALLYYVEEYHVLLPQGFLSHAESQQWRIDASAVKVEALSSEAFDRIEAINGAVS